MSKLVRPAGGGPLHLAIDSTGLKVHGEGEWKIRMHGKGRRRVGRKLHLGVDTPTGTIVAPALTPSETHDGTELDGLLVAVDGKRRPRPSDFALVLCREGADRRGAVARQGLRDEVSTNP